LLLTGLADLWQLAAIEVLNGMATAFTFPALQGMLPQIVARKELQQANALNGLVRNATLIGGGAIAGAIVAFVGPGWGLAADAAAYGLATLLISRIKLPDTPSDGAADGNGSNSAWRDLREGWDEFVARRWVWVIVLAFGLINAAIGCGLHTLGPVVADETFGRVGWGLLQSGFGVGLVLGALIMLRWRPRLPLVAGMVGTLLTAGQLLMLGLHPSVVPLLVVYFFAGVGLDVFGVGWETALQQHVPGDRLSRVASYDALGSFVAIPIGQLAAGPLASVFGTSTVITGCGLLIATVVGITIADPSVRGLRRVEPAARTA
jgi:MFS family permease